MDAPPMPHRPKPRMLTFRSGGWVLLLAAVVSVAGVATQIIPRRLAPRRPVVGDGRRVESYGFDLSGLRAPRHLLAASGNPRDGIPALVSPRTLSASAAASLALGRRGRYLVPSDRVVGLTLAGEARAYPLRVLAWHEVVNDVLAGEPIAVTYHPLCESIAVYSRRASGRTLELGVSGLLLRSNLLLYDRSSAGSRESLWSQIDGSAVAGPAAAARLALEGMPCSLTTWERWRRAHPSTTVLAPDTEKAERYERDPYATYFASDRLRFPVEPLPSMGPALKTRVLVLEGGGATRTVALEPGTRPGPSTLTWEGGSLEIDGSERPASVIVLRPPAAGARVAYAFWFAWYAARPDTPPPG